MNTLFDIQENRKARKAERTRVDILEAAARAFARNTRATMQDIAAEAGYTVPSLYAYFRSKEEITQGLNDLVNREMMSAFDLPYPDSLTFAQKLELLLRHSLEFVDRRRDTFAVLMQQMSDIASEEADQPLSRFSVAHLRVADWMRVHTTPADLGGRAPEDVALLLMGVFQTFFIHWLSLDRPPSLTDRASLMVDLLLHGASGPHRDFHHSP